MLVNSFKLSDIRDYEDSTGNNILEYFSNIKLCSLIDLVSLGNNNCGEERASELLDNYFATGMTIVDGLLEIKEKLLGKGRNEESDVGDDSLIDITDYKNLTQLYELYCMQLMSVGLSYTEFWSLTTNTLFRIFETICIKRQNEINQSLQIAYTQAGLIGQAVWGKLQKNAPQVDIAKPIGKTYDGMDTEQAIMVAKLKGMEGLKK